MRNRTSHARRCTRLVLSGLAMFFLAACITPTDRPARLDVSIHQHEVRAGTFLIRVDGAPIATAEGVKHWFHRRAKELAGGHDYEFWLKVEQFDSKSNGITILGPAVVPYERHLDAWFCAGGIRVLPAGTGQAREIAPPDNLRDASARK